MKRILLIVCVVVCMALVSGTVYAEEVKTHKESGCTSNAPINTDDMRYHKTPLNKLGRGAINTLVCWLEVPAEVCRVSEKNGPVVGCTLGLVEGLGTTLLRGATGIFDAVTFVIPPYNKPLMRPEYAMDSLGNSASDFADSQMRP